MFPPHPAGGDLLHSPKWASPPRAATPARPQQSDDIPPPLFDTLRHIPPAPEWDGPEQMAADEFLLRVSPGPALRLFKWQRPQITFGYFGNFSSVSKQYPALPLTRRWTGGGIVEHGNDITFSLIVPGSHPASSLRGRDFYSTVHSILREALGECGVAARMASPRDFSHGDACFAAPVESDLLGTDGKIAGGAMRRTRWGILYQGSLRPPPSLKAGLQNSLPGHFCRSPEICPLQHDELQAIEQLASEKYRSPLWLLRRAQTPPDPIARPEN